MKKLFVVPGSEHIAPSLSRDFEIVGTVEAAHAVFQNFECHCWQGRKYQGDLPLILQCAELEPSVMGLLPEIDQPGVIFVHTGAVDYRPRHMRMIRYENFFFEIANLHRFVPGCGDLLQALNMHDEKTLAFDALIGRVHPAIKPHRVFLADRLAQAEPDCFFVSAFGSQNTEEWSTTYVWPTGAEPWEAGQDLRSQMEIRWHGQRTYLSHAIPDQIYQCTAYSIVAETYHDDSWSFFTEKTAKPLWCGRLFVMFAGRHYLQRLRDLGFRTFGSVIDESYDDESDADQRWRRAWQQVEWLAKQPQQPILDQIAATVSHNQRWLLQNDWSANRAIRTWLDTC